VFTVGRKVRFTPKGLSVISRQRADLVGQQFRRALRQPGDHAEAARVGDRSRQLGEAHEVHAALDDGVLDARTVR
jgi:hypothetical protein